MILLYDRIDNVEISSILDNDKYEIQIYVDSRFFHDELIFPLSAPINKIHSDAVTMFKQGKKWNEVFNELKKNKKIN